ncbi:MAG: alginate export family protein [Bacteroidota bacterium]
MKFTKLSFFFIFSIFSLQNAFSQFTINAELRPRFEFRDGYKQMVSTNPDPNFMVSQRSRLSFNFANDKVITKISFQDVRIWGDEKYKTDVASTGLKEGWVDIKLCDSLWLKMGRQEFNYDNERLMSSLNWNQVGVSHDGVLFHMKYNTWSLDAGGAFNQVSDATLWGTDYSLYSATNYKSLAFFWLSKKLGNLKITATVISDGYQKAYTTNTTYMRLTSGLSLIYKTPKFNASVRGYWQGGKDKNGVDINAWFAQADASYTLFKKLTLQLGYEHWSGQFSNTKKQNNSFNLLYGSAHKFNGSMDYFTSNDDVIGMGLNDLYFNITYGINNKLFLKADYHYFNTDKDFFYKGTTIYSFNKSLGNEIDLSAVWHIYPYLNLQGGYSFMLPSSSFKVAQFEYSGVEYNSSRIPQWAFVMLTFNMDIFKFGNEKK